MFCLFFFFLSAPSTDSCIGSAPTCATSATPVFCLFVFFTVCLLIVLDQFFSLSFCLFIFLYRLHLRIRALSQLPPATTSTTAVFCLVGFFYSLFVNCTGSGFFPLVLFVCLFLFSFFSSAPSTDLCTAYLPPLPQLLFFVWVVVGFFFYSLCVNCTRSVFSSRFVCLFSFLFLSTPSTDSCTAPTLLFFISSHLPPLPQMLFFVWTVGFFLQFV